MIKLLKQGSYKIVETWGETRILVLDDRDRYAWVVAAGIGEILVTTKKRFNKLYTLARGKFRLYEVKDEPKLTGVQHLELYVGEGFWQGYLLPTGLPKNKDIRNKIVPTNQIITETSNLRLLA
jgi:hypothetical protein